MITRRGFTLIELLAVCTILGLVAGVGLGALARLGRADPHQQALAIVQAQFHEAEGLARERGGLDLRCGPEGVAPLDAVSSSEALPASLRIGRPAGPDLTHYRLDGRGRGPDLRCAITQDGETQVYRRSGASGLWLREDDHAP